MGMVEDLSRHVGKFYGKYSGIVVRNDDEDCTLGKLWVKVPSIFGEEADPILARPCLPFGHFFVPPPDTLMWVEFEAGDLEFPIWVGVWYPEGGVPEPADIKPPDNRMIHTPSGHTIEVLDKEGEEKIVIKHKSNAFVALDKDGSVTIGNKNGSFLSLDANQNSISLMEQHGHMLTMTENSLILTNKDGAFVELSGDVARIAAPQVAIQSSSVALGADAVEPTILGQTFMQTWNLMCFHTHGTAMGPTTPPIPTGTPLAPGNGLTSAVLVK